MMEISRMFATKPMTNMSTTKLIVIMDVTNTSLMMGPTTTMTRMATRPTHSAAKTGSETVALVELTVIHVPLFFGKICRSAAGREERTAAEKKISHRNRRTAALLMPLGSFEKENLDKLKELVTVEKFSYNSSHPSTMAEELTDYMNNMLNLTCPYNYH